MKNKFVYKTAIAFSVCAFLFSNLFAKLEDGNHPQQQPVDSMKAEQAEKIPAIMSLSYFKKADGSEIVKVRVWYKEGRKNIPVENAVVNLYLDEVSKEGMLTNLITDENGEGEILLPDRFYQRAEGKLEYNFIARMFSEALYEPTEEEITVKRATIEISVSDEDKTITATLFEISEGGKTPVADAEIKIGIKRSFSILPIGEPLTTDENGVVSIECPSDIPGDSIGNLIVVAKVEDHDEYGTFENEKAVQWGIPISPEIHKDRTLWASGRNAPISLVAVSVAIVFGIWGTLLYLVIQLFKIKKLGKQSV